MRSGSSVESLSSFEAARSMSSVLSQPNDAFHWAQEMSAVARRRDRDSFMRIYDHFVPRVLRYLRGLGCAPSIAEELAQEALLRVWQRAASYDSGRSNLSTWLFRIARNLHIDRVRKEQHWTKVQDGLDNLDGNDAELAAVRDHAPSPEAFTEHTHLQRSVDRLPAVQARLIRMSYYEAKTHQEISDELGMPLGTVKSHLRRAFLKLQIASKDAP